MESCEPDRIYPMPAQDMPSIHPSAEYLVPESEDVGAQWKTVHQQATAETATGDGATSTVVTVEFGDGSHRSFDPEDTVDVGWAAP